MDAVLDNIDLVVRAFGYTLLLFVIAGVLSLLLGTVLAAMRVGPIGVLDRAATVYVTVVRNTPLLLVLLFFRIAGPKIGIRFDFVDMTIGDFRINNVFTACAVGLTVYTAAFVCEAIRSGRQRGAAGAGRGGPRHRAAVRRRNARGGAAPGVPRDRPAMASVQIAMLKNTTVCGTVGVLEAFARMRSLTNDYTHPAGRHLPHVRGRLRRPGVRDQLRREPCSSGVGGWHVSGSVLFDAPGPRTRARHRVYTIVSVVGVVLLLAFFVYRLYSERQLEYEKWEPFVTPKYVRALLVDGLLTTLSMAASAIVLAVVLGVVLGVGKLSDHGWVRWPCWAVVEFFRAVPVLLLMVLFFYSFGISRGESRRVLERRRRPDPLQRRGARRDLPGRGARRAKGQSEAAYAIGMRKTQVMSQVLLPQAVKIMLPAIISQCVVVLKDTSLGYAVAAPGLTQVGRDLYNGFGNQVPAILVIASIYIVVNMVLTWLATRVQRRLVGERKPLGGPPGDRHRGGLPSLTPADAAPASTVGFRPSPGRVRR